MPTDPGESPTDAALASSLRHWARVRPDAPCLTCAGVTRSWREVYDRASRLAQGLLAAGVHRGDRVAYLGRNRSEFFELMMGASMAGLVAFAVNTRLSRRETIAVIADSTALVLVAETDALIPPAATEHELPDVRLRIGLDPDDAAPQPTWAAGVVAYDDWLADHDPVDPQVPVGDDDVALQIYTSGTTGRPKAAMFSNRALRASTRINHVLELSPESVVLIPMPVFHAAGSSLGIQAFQFGAHTVVERRVVAEDLLRVIARHRVTMTGIVPSVVKMLVESPALASLDVSSLRTVSYAASPISPDLLRSAVELFGCRFVQIYGMTETNMATVLYPEDHVNPDRPELLSSAGRPLPYASVRVVDPVTGTDVPSGQLGEIWIKAPSQMSGYWRRPEETAATLTADGYVRTGDGGYLENGYLFLKDRIKDMIVTGGENVYPVEIEHVLIKHPAIHDVAVAGVPSPRWGETVRAFVVRAAGSGSAPELGAADVIAYARANLAGYKCPTSVVFLDELPRNPTGKVLKRVLVQDEPVLSDP
jgi:long-chain acyl-CoA synthetase